MNDLRMGKYLIWQMSQLPPEYDDIQPQDYDPTFTADISTKMRVPDRIIPLNGFRTDPLNGYHDDINTDEQIKNQKRAASMSVPDKIVMGGRWCHLLWVSDLIIKNIVAISKVSHNYLLLLN